MLLVVRLFLKECNRITQFLIGFSLFFSDTLYLAQAYGSQTYAYESSVPPGIHGQDLSFTFAFVERTALPLNVTVAIAMQEYITSFAFGRIPMARAAGLPDIPFYGSSRILLNLTDTGIGAAKDSISAR